MTVTSPCNFRDFQRPLFVNSNIFPNHDLQVLLLSQFASLRCETVIIVTLLEKGMRSVNKKVNLHSPLDAKRKKERKKNKTKQHSSNT